MCVIIEKQPGKVVPYEHLLAGAHRNPDGYGAVVVDRGKLEIIRGLSKDFKQGADQVQKLLEQAKDNLAYVHYRYRTKGNVDIDNVHPFTVLKSKDSEVVFMHNGTVSGFESEKFSDSKLLCERIISPLAKRTAALLGDENVCCDPVMAAVLNQFAGGTYNKFVLVDNHGNSMVINRTTGAPQPYGWTSNSYSVEPAQVRKYLGNKEADKEETKSFPGLPHSVKSTNAATTNVVSLGSKLSKAKNTNKASPRYYHPSIRQTVADLTGFDLKDFCYFDADQIRNMVEDQPDLSAVLILDLLAKLYDDEFKAVKVG